MSFSNEIKSSLIIQSRTLEEKYSFLQGYIAANAKKTISKNNEQLLFIKNLEHQVFIENLLKDFNYFYEIKKYDIYITDIKTYKSSLQVKNFVSGLFLAGGSINSLDSSSYHLEIKINSTFYFEKIKKVFDKLELDFSYFKRNNRYIFYIKKYEKISDFLKMLNISKQYFDFEEHKIERDNFNFYNRFVNLEISNQKKVVEANANHLNNINFIYDKKLEYLFSEAELNFFKLKLDNQYSSLNEIKDIMENEFKINKSKSALNHYLMKLKKIVIEYQK